MKIDHDAIGYVADCDLDKVTESETELREWTAGTLCRKDPSILTEDEADDFDDNLLNNQLEQSKHFWRGWLDGGSTISFSPVTESRNASPRIQAGNANANDPRKTTGFKLFVEAVIKFDEWTEKKDNGMDPNPITPEEEASLRRQAENGHLHLNGDLAHKVLWLLYDSTCVTLPHRRSLVIDAVRSYEPNEQWKKRQKFVKRRKSAGRVDLTSLIEARRLKQQNEVNA